MTNPPQCAVDDPRLKAAVYAVEASSFERHALWMIHSKEAKEIGAGVYGQVEWRQDSGGWLTTVGDVYGRPVNLSITFDVVDGALLLFWDPVSQLVDYAMCEKWLTENVPAYAESRRCNADNFGHALNHARGLREGK